MVLLLLSALTALLVLTLIGALLISIYVPDKRIWPPPAPQSWQFFLVWGLTLAAFAASVVVGILDWNSLGWPAGLRWPVGLGLIVVGNGVAWLGVAQLSMTTTSGAKGPLVTGGLYRYSRNPQYVGNILMLLGWIVLSASAWVVLPAALGIAAFALTPLAEEGWLAARFGEAYRDYCRDTPRFVGMERRAG